MEILKNKKIYKASVTVEAAMSFTLTIFILFMIIGPLFIIRKSADVITEMNTLNKLACYYEEARYQIGKNATSSEAMKKVNDYVEDFDEAENFINAGYVLYHLYESHKDKDDPLNNINNIVSLNDKVYDEDTGIVCYDFLFDFKLPLNVLKVKNIEQRFVVSRRAFIGASENRFDEGDDEAEIFLARNFKIYKVYHMSPTCTYLKKELLSGNKSHINTERNESGERYSKCTYCIKERVDDTTIYFYTVYGHLYHKNKNCPLMTAYVSKVASSYIEKYDLRLCSRCEKKYGSEKGNEKDNEE